MGVEPVDADRHGLALGLPVDVVQGLDDIGPRLHLLGRRDRVFEVEEDVVDIRIGGLVDHRGVGARHGQFRPLQALLFQRVQRVAHVWSFLAGALVAQSPLAPAWRDRGRQNTFPRVRKDARGWAAGLNG